MSGRLRPPAGLEKPDIQVWRTTRQALSDRGEFDELVDGPLLERYALALTRARRARARIRGLTAKGSQDQVVEAPMLRIARAAERDAHEYALALGITPEQRRRRGKETPGANQDPPAGSAFD